MQPWSSKIIFKNRMQAQAKQLEIRTDNGSCLKVTLPKVDLLHKHMIERKKYIYLKKLKKITKCEPSKTQFTFILFFYYLFVSFIASICFKLIVIYFYLLWTITHNTHRMIVGLLLLLTSFDNNLILEENSFLIRKLSKI